MSSVSVCATVTEVGALSAACWAWSLRGIFRAGHGLLGLLGMVETRFGVSQLASSRR